MADTAEAPARNSLYDIDFYEWTQEQARLLGSGRWHDLDLDNLIEEVRSVGLSDKREIESRLQVLVAHLLKWRYQPGQRSSGWAGTIREQRRRIKLVGRDSPSLRGYPSAVFVDEYLGARLKAADETGIDFSLFPETCPFTVEEALDDDFLPPPLGGLDRSAP